MLAPIVPIVIRQHVEDTAVLHATRTALTTTPHVKLHHLRRFDDRLAAHLDGLSVAGEDAWSICEAALESPSPGAVFIATIRAIEDNRSDRLDRLFALAEAVPEARSGLMSAFGWMETTQLRGMVVGLLASTNAFKRHVGMAACAMHRVDPGKAGGAAASADSPELQARALRTAGELGRRDVLPNCLTMLHADDAASRFWAAWSAVLLGNRKLAIEALLRTGSSPGPFRTRAFRLALQVLSTTEVRAVLQPLAQDPAQLRWAIMGVGITGDVSYIPWLMSHMSDDKLTRVAGEAFSLITGADLAWLDLERKPPENFESGPNDNPDDPNVDMDPDDGLPWADMERVKNWWATNAARFQPGERYFVGAPVTRDHCIEVLKNGYQRQRILAAHYLCLLNPGTPLFEWRAPAWRQQLELAKLS